MKLFGKDLDTEIPIVAEVGVNHEGDVDTASKLLRLASEAGADAVKFQSYTPERYASASDPERLARVRKFALDEEAHRRLAREGDELGIAVFSSSLSEDWVPFLAGLFPAIKIASGDLTFEPVVRAAARTGKPVVLSTGLGTIDEVEAAIGWAKEEIGEYELRDRLILMHCVSAYPTPMEQANLLSIPFLAERTGLRVGYSNHVIGSEACLTAVALGACMLEVHFTDCKTGREFRDHALSFEPDDLRNLVNTMDRICSSLGSFDKVPMECELANRKAIRKGAVAARDLSPDTVLKHEDLMFARPATEFDSSEVYDLIGATLTSGVKAGELVPRFAVRRRVT